MRCPWSPTRLPYVFDGVNSSISAPLANWLLSVDASVRKALAESDCIAAYTTQPLAPYTTQPLAPYTTQPLAPYTTQPLAPLAN